jgi:hypothetical protein
MNASNVHCSFGIYTSTLKSSYIVVVQFPLWLIQLDPNIPIMAAMMTAPTAAPCRIAVV